MVPATVLRVHEDVPRDIKEWAKMMGASGQNSRLMVMTGEFAKAILDSAPPNVRGVQFIRATVNQYKRDLLAGKWVVTHQGIAFDVNGDFRDGFNRLQAIVETGIAVQIYVTWGVPVEGLKEVDGGTKRSLGASIGCSKRVASYARLFHEMPEVGREGRKTRSELLEIVEKCREGLEFAAALTGNIRIAVGILVARIFYHVRHDEEKLQMLRRFCEILRDVQGKVEDLPEAEHAAGQFRKKLREMSSHTGSSADCEVYCLAQTAIQHFFDRRPIGIFRQTRTNCFPVLSEQQ